MVNSILAGQNPLEYNASDPITLLLFQIIIILTLCHLIHLILYRLWQPRVISEVIAGLLLGPSVMGHIPNFTETIFPTPSIPILNSASTLGLVFLMFLVGLEMDISGLRENLKPALAVAFLGMALPFGLGCALAVGLYGHFQKAEEGGGRFGVYALFIGLALAITAFPILARILMTCNLLDTPVGIIALAAGVANDVVGWSLLALAVTLAKAGGSGIIALYIILSCIGLVLFMTLAVSPALALLHKKFGMKDFSTPCDLFLGATLMVVLAASLFTSMLGIHPIFGAFLAGCITPKDADSVERITSKLSTLVYAILLPPFFALCGLNTNIGSLASALDWAYVFAIIVTAFLGKTAAGYIAARVCKMGGRESLTVGVLLSCKGVVELIALNVGLQAGIIEERCYTAMVIMAVILTGATQPLVVWLYPVGKRGESSMMSGVSQNLKN